MSREESNNFPFYESVAAGLPFTPETGGSTPMDISKYLINHPASTYFVRVKGDSMEGAGILSGDIVILDRSRIAKTGDIVIASLEGETTLKTLEQDGKNLRLIPANPLYPPIVVTGECEILGVVIGSFRKYH